MAKTVAIDPSLSLSEESGAQSVYQKVGGTCVAIAVLALVSAVAGAGHKYPSLLLTIIVGMFALGTGAYALPYYQGIAGIRNNGIMFTKMNQMFVTCRFIFPNILFVINRKLNGYKGCDIF